MGHTFDATDFDSSIDFDTLEAGPAERDARWLDEHVGQTPLTFPFPMHTPDIPLQEPGSGGSRRAG